MKAFVVGTAGHVDHGKTALVRALTGVDTDRWDEEKERGLTIDLGFAPLEMGEEREIGIVDVPGHEDFVTNMLAGATGLDLLLLVVAADEGPMPQTREHLTIANLLGVDAGVVALTKVDRVDDEWLALVRETVEEELRTVLGHAGWPVLAVSATEDTGVDAIREEIRERAGKLRERSVTDLFRLPVDRSFSVRGAGTVVTGTAWSGTVRVDDRLRVLPQDRSVRVRSLQVHGTDRSEVGAGRRCALALVGVDPEDVPRGSVLVEGDAWRATDRIGARIRLPGHVDRSVEDGQRVRIYLGTREVMARADLARAMVLPGETVRARFFLEQPLVPRARDRFVIRFYSPVVTLGGGMVADRDPGPDWPDRGEAWAGVLDGRPAEALASATRLRGGAGLSTAEAPLDTGLALESLDRVLEGGPPGDVIRVGDRWFPGELASEVRSELRHELARMHRENRRSAAVSLEALRNAVADDVHGGLIERALDELAAGGEIVVEGPRVRLPDHRPRLTGEEASTAEEIRDRIDEGGLEPPMVPDLKDGLGLDERVLHDLLTLLEEAGDLVAVTPELYLSAGWEERLRERAREVLEHHASPVPVSPFKERLDVSRKYLIPYLEHLDRVGITRRTGDGRRPAAGEDGAG